MGDWRWRVTAPRSADGLAVLAATQRGRRALAASDRRVVVQLAVLARHRQEQEQQQQQQTVAV
jgi:hypothetical protein